MYFMSVSDTVARKCVNSITASYYENQGIDITGCGQHSGLADTSGHVRSCFCETSLCNDVTPGPLPDLSTISVLVTHAVALTLWTWELTFVRLLYGYSHQFLTYATHQALVKCYYDDVIKMETFSALLALCAENSPVTGEFPAQRPVTRSFDVFFHLCLNKRLSKQSWGWWFETPSHPLWRHCNVMLAIYILFFSAHDCVGHCDTLLYGTQPTYFI